MCADITLFFSGKEERDRELQAQLADAAYAHQLTLASARDDLLTATQLLHQREQDVTLLRDKLKQAEEAFHLCESKSRYDL